MYVKLLLQFSVLGKSLLNATSESLCTQSFHLTFVNLFMHLKYINRNLTNLPFGCGSNVIGIICSMHVDVGKSFQMDGIIKYFFLFLI